MKKDLSVSIEIPQGVEVQIEDNLIVMKKENKELKREYSGFHIKKDDNKLILYEKKATKKEKKMMMTIAAHIKNMIRGLEKGFEYKLEVCFVHFPMSVEFKQDKHEFSIKNFLGETKPRIIKLPENVDVKIDGNIITINSYNKEYAGETASRIERLSKIRKKDRRVFQDGIFIIEKPGRQIS